MSTATTTPLLLLALLGCSGSDDKTGATPTETDVVDPDGLAAPLVRFENESPTTLDDLTVLVGSEQANATYVFTWSVDDVARPDLTTEAIPAVETQRGQRWTVSVVASVGQSISPAATASVTVLNAPPAGQVEVTPAAPDTTSDLVAALTPDDPDGDDVTWNLTWTADDGTNSGGVTVPSVLTMRGQTWTVSALPFDGELYGQAITSEVTIENAPPTAKGSTLTPVPATSATPLLAQLDSPDDPDGDAIDVTWTWSVNGTTVLGVTGPELPTSAFTRGDLVEATATLEDGTVTVDLPAISSVIANAYPIVDDVEIAPDPAVETSTLSCGAQINDPENDPVDLTVVWTVEGSTIIAETIDGTSFDRGDAVSCLLTASDGIDTSPPISSATLTISNSPPTLDDVQITPAVPSASSVLEVQLINLVDADPTDSPTVLYSWEVDGVVVGTGPTLSGGLQSGDLVTVTVTPTDGITTGTSLTSAPVLIGNAAPSVSSVFIDPALPTAADDLEATYVASDPDGDPVSVSFSWTIDGVGVGTGPILPAGTHSKGDSVFVTLTPTDGSLTGTPFEGGPRLIQNAPPTLGIANISPAVPVESDTLSCQEVDANDVDGDNLTFGVRWRVNSALVSTDPSLSTIWFGRDDEVSCELRANDGEDNSPWVLSPTVTVANSAPVLDGLMLSPTVPQNGQPLNVAPTLLTDIDNDPVTVDYVWSVNGVDVYNGQLLPGSFVTGGASIQVTATPSDGTTTGTAVTLGPLTIGNAPPVLSTVLLTPINATTVDDVSASWTAVDADGDQLTTLVTFTVNGQDVQTGTTATLGASAFERDDTVQATVEVTDGTTSVSSTSIPLVINNSAPTLSAAEISPSAPTATDDLTCIGLGWFDADNDPEQYLTYWYAGFAGGSLSLLSISETLPSALFTSGQTLTCQLVPFDQTGDTGPPVNSAPITVVNTPPTLLSAALTDVVPSETQDVTAVPGDVDDPDGDIISFDIVWTINGVSGPTGPTLTGLDFDEGQQIYATITPFDGQAYGAPVDTPTVIAGNTPPTVLSATLGPLDAIASDPLTATATGSDLDALDTVVFLYEWFVDGVSVQNGAADTLPPGFTQAGSEVYVSVTATDLQATSPAYLSDVLVVGNTLPIITDATLDPDPIYESTTVSCLGEGWFDPDGHPEDYTYLWYVNNVIRSTAATVDGARFGSGDEVFCVLTPCDPGGCGTSVQSNTLVVQNTAPTANSAAINRLEPRENDVLGVFVTGALDIDGDPLTTTVEWFVDGVSTSTALNLTGADFDKGDAIYALVTLTDGLASITLTTPTVFVVNTPPIVTTLDVGPEQPTTLDDMTATWMTYDADGDDVTVSLQWQNDGLDIVDETDVTLDASFFVRGDDIRVVALPNDGEEDGVALTSDAVTIINTPPTIASASLDPAELYENTFADCIPGGLDDVDGDSTAVSYRWFINGIAGPAGPTIYGNSYNKHDEVACQLTPLDGTTSGTPVMSETITVLNTVPTIDALVFSTETPTTNQNVVPTAVGLFDPDPGDLPIVEWSWTVNTVPVSNDRILDASLFESGDTLVVTATAFDGEGYGPPFVGQTLTAANSPPTTNGLPSLSPSVPTTLDDVTVSLPSATDPDGDPVTWEFTWLVDGAPVTQATSTVLSSSVFSKGQTIQVVATASDGQLTSNPVSSSILVVQNSTPGSPEVTVTPAAPIASIDDITCTIETPSVDADNDPLTYTFTWVVDGLEWGNTTDTATSSTVDAAFIGAAETWLCTATAYDGEATSPASAAADANSVSGVFNECGDYLAAGITTTGVYTISPTSTGPFDAWCDQTTDGGGWTRVVRTTGQGLNVGQDTSAIVTSYASVTANEGVYQAFGEITNISEVMIRAVSGVQAGQFATYSTYSNSGGRSMLGLMEYCRDEGVQTNNDTWFSGQATVGHTHEYSGTRVAGSLEVWDHLTGLPSPLDYLFICGVNTSSDNDVSYLSFTNDPGNANNWGDAWRGEDQVGTLWSFANGDYCCSGSTHIGTPALQGFAGWKGSGWSAPAANHPGTYEIYVR
ncbi:MAG: fibrinogen-like YCDxxxxGGGW domain-containing protein [Myxococcota bacterium]